MVRDGWNGFNVLHTAAARVGGLDLGFVPGTGRARCRRHSRRGRAGAIEVVYLLGADEIRHGGLGQGIRRSIRAITATQGARARRRGVARGRLYREERDLGQYRGHGFSSPAAPFSRPVRRARTGRSCARCREALGHKLPYDRLARCRRLVEVNPISRMSTRSCRLRGGSSAPRERRRAGNCRFRSMTITRPTQSAARRRRWRNAPAVLGRSSAKTGTHG